MSRASLFFDLDGTLTDPVEGITRSISHALRLLGVPSLAALGVTWGYGSQRELLDAGADLLCRAPEDIRGCLDAIGAHGKPFGLAASA